MITHAGVRVRTNQIIRRAVAVTVAALVGASITVGTADAAPAQYDGVRHREFSTTAGGRPVVGDIVEVDLTRPRVRAELLDPGVIAARSTVAHMADDVGAVAAINGDFFDIGRTGAPAGPAVMDGRPLKAAVPQGRRAAPPVAGAEPDYVFSVGADGRARIDRLRLDAAIIGDGWVQPVVALNQHAVPVGGIGIFTSVWGDYDRARTLCGSDTDRTAPCAPDRFEALVRDGEVVSTGPAHGGQLAPGEIALVGRDEGAAALRGLHPGQQVQVRYRLEPASGVQPRFAVGGMPIVQDGKAIDNPISNAERAPRSAAGFSADGRTMYLITVDGRQADSGGMTLPEFARQLADMGVHSAVNLDGGGSSTLVYRKPGDAQVAVVNDPADPSPRLVANAIGVSIG